MLKYEEQQKELEKLEKELTALRIQNTEIKNKGPKTPVAELKQSLEEKQAQLEKLTGDFAGLKKSEEEATQALEEIKEQVGEE